MASNLCRKLIRQKYVIDIFGVRLSVRLVVLLFSGISFLDHFGIAQARIRLPGIFGDHMVLQQGVMVPVWGWASPGEKITVTIGTESRTTTANDDGRWRVNFPPLQSHDGPETVEINGTNTITLHDVLVGEVWLASGQSNMEFGIQTDADGADAARTATDSSIRMFFVPWATSLEPQSDISSATTHSLDGKWQVCTPETMAA